MANLAPLPNPGKTKPLRALDLIDFTGGLNTTDDRFEVQPNEVRDCKNVDFDPQGGFSLRKGSTAQIDDTAGRGTNLTYWKNKDRIIVNTGTGTTDNVAYANSSSGTSWTVQSTGGSAIPVGFGRRYNSAELNGFFYFPTGARKWDGTSWTAMTAVDYVTGPFQDSYASPSRLHLPTAEVCCSHLSMLWVAATVTVSGSDIRERVRWSHPGEGGSWRTNDYIDIEGGGQINGLVAFRDVLIVLCSKAVFAIQGYDASTFTVTRLADFGTGFGSDTEYSACESELGVFFGNYATGIWLIDHNFTITNVSTKIQQLFTDNTITKLDMQFGGSLRRRLYILVNGISGVEMLVWDPSMNAWSQWDLPFTLTNARLLAVDSAKGSDIKLYLPNDTANGYLVRLEQDITTDTGGGVAATHIDGYVTTGWHAPGSPAQKKTWKRPDLIYRASGSGTFTVTSYIDWINTTDKTMSFSQAGSGSDYEVDRGQTMGQARAMSVKIAGPTAQNVTWSVDDITLKYRSKPLR